MLSKCKGPNAAASLSKLAISSARRNSASAARGSSRRALFAAPKASSPKVIEEIPTCPTDLPRSFFNTLGGLLFHAKRPYQARIPVGDPLSFAQPSSLRHPVVSMLCENRVVGQCSCVSYWCAWSPVVLVPGARFYRGCTPPVRRGPRYPPLS